MKSNITKLYLLIFMSMISFISNAQPVDPPGDADPPPAPINMYVILLGVLGIYFAYTILNKRILEKK